MSCDSEDYVSLGRSMGQSLVLDCPGQDVGRVPAYRMLHCTRIVHPLDIHPKRPLRLAILGFRVSSFSVL